MNTLLVVDFQKDFCPPNGSLAVPGANELLPKINDLALYFFERAGYQVVYTRDWHPADHISFATSHEGKKPFEQIGTHQGLQTLWPEHCVRTREGSEFHKDLAVLGPVFPKGMALDIEEYSGAWDLGAPLSRFLMNSEVIFVCGLATDYCVKEHALDLHRQHTPMPRGIVVVEDAVAGVDPETTSRALKGMRSAGIGFKKASEIIFCGKGAVI